MKNYTIWIISPPDYPHSRAFDEVALSLHYGFKNLGIDVPIARDPMDVRGIPIILGANVLSAMKGNLTLPRDTIIYNLEQITPGSRWLTDTYLSLLSQLQVWDYSDYNIEQLAKLGITNVKKCPIGYVDELQRVPHGVKKDIDVLFYGSVNERRRTVLNGLKDEGINIQYSRGHYDAERDAIIARAKIVLNVHFYEAKIFEMVRVSYLLANKVCVVSEDSPSEEALDAVKDGIALCEYGEIVSRCKELLADDAARDALAQKGYELFSAQKQEAALKGLLT